MIGNRVGARNVAARVSLGLVVAAAFFGMRLLSLPNRSATFDEPLHVAAGYAALAGDFSVDPTHPPLVRALAALPLRLMHPPEPATIDALHKDARDSWLEPSRRLVFQWRDADRALQFGRTIVALIGAVLALVVMAWAYEWRGTRAALVAGLCCLISPALAAHSELITTDIGATCGITAALYMTWRFLRRPTWQRAIAIGLVTGLALVAKFTALILAPALALVFGAAVIARRLPWRRAAGAALIVTLMSVAVIWGTYGFRYHARPDPTFQLDYRQSVLIDRAPLLAQVTTTIDRWHLLPNAYTQGLLFSIASARAVPVLLGGRIWTAAPWYAAPLVFVLKTPLAMLVLALAGVLVGLWSRNRTAALLLGFTALFGGIAITNGVTLGVRHLLPIFPPLILLIANAIVTLWDAPRYTRVVRAAIVIVMLFWGARFAQVYPNTLTFFNAFARANRGAWLADSNLDWGQHLKQLKSWMDDNHVERINLAYFGTADPAYYGIKYTRLPSQQLIEPRPVDLPVLPGYVAVSRTAQAGVYLPPEWRLFYEGLAAQTPVATISNTIRVYWLEKWPEAPTATTPDASRINATRSLARLLVGRGWTDLGLRYYTRYALRRSKDVDALFEMGIAAAAHDRPRAASGWLRRAAELAPMRVDVARALTASLLQQGDLPGALAAAERVVSLDGAAAESQDLLGRALALNGRSAEAIRAFERALAIDPAFQPARDALAALRPFAWPLVPLAPLSPLSPLPLA